MSAQLERSFQQLIPYALSDAECATFRELSEWRSRNYSDENDPLRILQFQRLLRQVADLPEGDYVEMGTQYGGTAKIIWDLMPRDRHLFCCDTFKGFTQEDLDAESAIAAHGFTTESIAPLDAASVEKLITERRPQDGKLHLVAGRVPMSLAPLAGRSWRFVHLDMDLYEPTRGALEWIWPHLVPGAAIVFHDYDALPTVKKAADEFLNPRGVVATPMSDRFGSAVAYKPLAAPRLAMLRSWIGRWQ
ncbi:MULTISPECIES: class I SAM-dependent methyltransferase [unclassified Bradyrhizobium]|uniref:class I SAM-dependent methyltransferase n=1 Tax=unclassified Bradyrhizobium TaxID=2631580 RepID=UPI002915E53D|nr:MULTISPECIES: class I SAM-dependent methyltransferase [unclassified Bradyrhizobium]